MVPAGKLDRLIQFEVQTRTTDTRFNARVIEYVPYGAKAWAQVIESSAEPGANPAAAEGVAAYVKPTKVRIRWRGDIDKTRMRINYGGRLLRIIGTAELGRREDLEIACQEWAHENG